MFLAAGIINNCGRFIFHRVNVCNCFGTVVTLFLYFTLVSMYYLLCLALFTQENNVCNFTSWMATTICKWLIPSVILSRLHVMWKRQKTHKHWIYQRWIPFSRLLNLHVASFTNTWYRLQPSITITIFTTNLTPKSFAAHGIHIVLVILSVSKYCCCLILYFRRFLHI